MNELIANDYHLAKARHVISIGYDDTRGVDPQYNNGLYGFEAKKMALQIHTTFQTHPPHIVTNTGSMQQKTESALSHVSETMTDEGLLFFYYAGHGLPDTLLMPDIYSSSKEITLLPWEKRAFFEKVGQIPGRKIIILNTCYADAYTGNENNSDDPFHIVLPEQTILIASSHNNQATRGSYFTKKIAAEIAIAGRSNNPLACFIDMALNRLHNYPFTSLRDDDTAEEFMHTPVIYGDELARGKAAVTNWQREQYK